MKKIIFFLSLFSAYSCSTSYKLSSKASDLTVAQTKPTQCQVVGKVVGVHPEGSRDLALNHALNQAADQGADTLFIEQTIPNGQEVKVIATTYRCQ